MMVTVTAGSALAGSVEGAGVGLLGVLGCDGTGDGVAGCDGAGVGFAPGTGTEASIPASMLTP
ncbi:hypothetical protein [Rathayibacter sp. VKM Ac-2927]|uniref:hypothetical protein n=1 Tax=Rathayibacter sp. VKM Ac-2927 TaxID=2929478 RepID=UPI001FB551D8|nr:hypothetical protein [Rathayibacter sp. VKM Ac-2927]MCJ1687513.1 hypothetical protein [Rathayibacter sp. VKM Ac-2927]